jgi:uncharacterized damage-inducible protein DinB
MNINRDIIRDLYGHMQWADAEVWRAAKGIDDAKLLGLLQHIHVVQRAFLLMWTDAELAVDELYAKRDATELQAFARAYYADSGPYLEQLDESTFGRIVHMPWLPLFERQLGRSLQAPTLAETLYQVPMHSTYHRGQANVRIREAGGEPAAVDYIAWVWLGRPQPRWK